ncbi:acyl-CoA carboxylase epsilon subunit-like protein [Humibacillus xanthopallidus]|uniref:Acyl-CoA carboxylase epsilon subunit-like protein n=1 Tax=Humibacillus xanthopallidus TaxID=412689 RepID=A0A543PX97_9MICO|nr:acyl-CoA carboxylase subunit epsilon [Humibacillus xanthopallidus]TQN48695.1 acyl-CoA carboxylase epsilon subunit-like protein [Humibacillus xanthopallidus]
MSEANSARSVWVSGNPSAEELAALVVVLSALGGGEESGAGKGRSAWADPAWHLVGPSTRIGGWRASALPR